MGGSLEEEEKRRGGGGEGAGGESRNNHDNLPGGYVSADLLQNANSHTATTRCIIVIYLFISFNLFDF